MTDLADAVVPAAACLDLAEVRDLAESAGSYWFSPNTERHFRTVYIDLVYGGAVWVQGDRSYDGLRIEWTLAHIDSRGHIDYLPGSPSSGRAALHARNQPYAARCALEFEAGRPALQRVDYDAHVECSEWVRQVQHQDGVMRCAYASWLVDEEAYCHSHTGAILADMWARWVI